MVINQVQNYNTKNLFFVYIELNHFVNIDSSGSVLVGSRSSWLCEVNCVQPPHIQWLDNNGVPVPSSGLSVWTEKTIINETMTHLRLHINAVRSSHAGTYTCTSSVVFPPSTKQDSVDVIVKCKS